jgi:hypothetical protein
MNVITGWILTAQIVDVTQGIVTSVIHRKNVKIVDERNVVAG